MIFSDAKDQKMPVRSAGGLQPEEEWVDLPLGGDLVPHSDEAGLPEEEAGLLGEGKDILHVLSFWFIKLWMLLRLHISLVGKFS